MATQGNRTCDHARHVLCFSTHDSINSSLSGRSSLIRRWGIPGLISCSGLVLLRCPLWSLRTCLWTAANLMLCTPTLEASSESSCLATQFPDVPSNRGNEPSVACHRLPSRPTIILAPNKPRSRSGYPLLLITLNDLGPSEHLSIFLDVM